MPPLFSRPRVCVRCSACAAAVVDEARAIKGLVGGVLGSGSGSIGGVVLRYLIGCELLFVRSRVIIYMGYFGM